MILRYYPTKDSTIYEKAPSTNAGVDQILEITKQGATGNTGGAVTSSYNSRILLDFDYTAISSSIVALGYDPNEFEFGLKLYATEASEIPLEYSLEAYPVSGSWSMGTGKAANIPATTEGVSWYYKSGKTDLTSAWATESFATNVTASWQVNPGGGTWYTSSVASQSFNYTTTDVDMNITDIVHEIQSASFDFNGLVLKKNDTAEQSLTTIGALRFYSKETNTIYSPVVEAKYDDSINTGSADLIDVDEEFNIIASNLRPVYKEGARPTLKFSSRYRYPPSAFQTSSVFLNNYKLPENTQYAVYYAQSDDAVINFSEYTKLSTNDGGSYFKLHLDSFQPERYYRIMIKVPATDGVSYDIYDKDWIFKIERNQ
mgnify:CR=1 FL=1